MQVGVHQFLVLAAAGAFAAAVGPQGRPLRVVLPVFAIQILGIGQGQRQAPARRRSEEHLGVAYTPRVNYFCQSVGKNLLSYNIFELHIGYKSTCKNTKYIQHSVFLFSIHQIFFHD